MAAPVPRDRVAESHRRLEAAARVTLRDMERREGMDPVFRYGAPWRGLTLLIWALRRLERARGRL